MRDEVGVFFGKGGRDDCKIDGFDGKKVRVFYILIFIILTGFSSHPIFVIPRIGIPPPKVEQKRLIYDTLQRRLNEARSSAKTSEQQLRDLYHVLDSTRVLAVGEKVGNVLIDWGEDDSYK